MIDAEDSEWSAIADVWAELWGSFADPSRGVVIDATGIGPGSRVLDVGCGSGEFLAMLGTLGAEAAGIDPARRMVEIARAAAPAADVRVGAAEELPWPDASFDVVTAFNALQFAEDTLDALAEMHRVTAPGGLVAIVNWAERDRNDLDAIDTAVAAAEGDEPTPDGELRREGGVAQLLADGGFEVVSAGLVEMPWEAPDAKTLLRGVLMGEDADIVSEIAPVVLAAAESFRTETGAYRLVNAFRYAVARRPAAAR
ncbi:class I SAM-dependent methyltransferase [Microbacterium sp. W4I20]|uniref:class I SAM-dependent methyltransferase n=1 Tax=Microbacterium sp. W4I20 TaxID=3042262 RepID=UPI002789A275|nr:class I SAM-dependent methyltransferase [Microbacterium sp. W4I20]MDQ0725312.1 SAM-dependent methyltransferase [Microbacterium sp. W4I20]